MPTTGDSPEAPEPRIKLPKRRIGVVVRVRPGGNVGSKGRRRSAPLPQLMHVVDYQTLSLTDKQQPNIFRQQRRKKRTFKFDGVLPPVSRQEDVYDLVESMLPELFNGINVCVFAYGSTGSGKTHTIIGSEGSLGDDGGAGLAPRTIGQVCRLASEQYVEAKIGVRFLELYNENLLDLLSARATPVELREDDQGQVEVVGARCVLIRTLEEGLRHLHGGIRRRTQRPTAANRTSSRSHAIMHVFVDYEGRRGQLILVDLAGSERAQGSENRGERLEEAANINRSLLTLGNVINKLHKQQQELRRKGRRRSKAASIHIPWRGSRLTRLLQGPLSGATRTLMICCVSPDDHVESLNTLLYGLRVSSLESDPHVELAPSKFAATTSVMKFEAEIKTLRKRLKRLADRLQISEFDRQSQQDYISVLIEELQRANIPIPECDSSFSETRSSDQLHVDEPAGSLTLAKADDVISPADLPPRPSGSVPHEGSTTLPPIAPTLSPNKSPSTRELQSEFDELKALHAAQKDKPRSRRSSLEGNSIPQALRSISRSSHEASPYAQAVRRPSETHRKGQRSTTKSKSRSKSKTKRASLQRSRSKVSKTKSRSRGSLRSVASKSSSKPPFR